MADANQIYENLHPWELWKESVKHTKNTIILITLLLYLPFQIFLKMQLASVYVSIVRFLEQGRFGLGGSSRFASLVEEWETPFRSHKASLFMGRSLYNPFLDVGLEDNRHMLTIAGSRAGKGTTVIIPNLLLWKGSALVIDPKGTNAAVTARHRREMGHNVYVVDPFGVLGKQKSASFNPLAALDPKSETIREEINIIADALVVSEPGQKDKHWDDGAKTIIAGLIGHLISSEDYTNPNLTMLRDLLTQLPEEQVELWADMSLNEGAGGVARDAANRVIRGIQTSEILSILSNADKHTEWLASPAIHNAIKETTFTFSELKNRPTTVYLVIPPQYLETHSRFLRLFVNMAISQMSVGGRSKTPVLMMLDEFLSLGPMNEVKKAFSLMAGYNLTIWPFVQDFNSLKELYGKSVNAFVTNSRAVQVFGVFDEETTGFVSKQIGNRSLSSVWITDQHRRGVPLRDPSEVARDIEANSGRQYILRAGRTALILEKVPYYEENMKESLNSLAANLIPVLGKWLFPGKFSGKFDKDPDYS